MSKYLANGDRSEHDGSTGSHSQRPLVEVVPISTLRPYPQNTRVHPRTQIRQLAKSIGTHGFIVPVVIDAKSSVICGHGRLEAARNLGMDSVPALRVTHLSEAEIRAYRIADNKIAENAEWDTDLLKIELNGLIELDANFDLEVTGFDAGEIDILLDTEESPETEVVPEPDRSAPAVTQVGDLWHIGPHRILCGDSLNPDSWSLLMAGDRAQMIYTDPPYNVRINGHVSGLGKARHEEFAMASGEMNAEEFTDFLRAAFELLVANACDTAIHFIFMDWRHMREVLAAADGVFDELKNLCVWAKTNAGMGSFYRSQHELVFAFKSGKGTHINNFGLGERGRHRSNLWTYAGANTFRSGRAQDLAAHPTVKPIEMARDAILDCSKRGGIVVDAFAGSGSTLVAAARAGRLGFGIEFDPNYVDLIVRRLQEETGEPAIHGETGKSFGAIEELKSGGTKNG